MKLDITPLSAPSIGQKLRWKSAVSNIETFLGEKPFLGSFIATFLLTLPILLFFRSYFQWDDDYYAVLLLKGMVLNSAPSEFNYLENVLLGLGLKNLYIQWPSIQWYSGLFILTHFLSIWAILTSFNLGANRFFKTFLFMLGSVVLEIRFLNDLQWTVVAAAASIGSFLLLAALWQKPDTKCRAPALVMVFVLIILSVLIRPNALGLIATAFAPTVIHLYRKVKRTSTHRALLAFFAITAILALTAVLFHHYYYFRNREWKDAVEIFKERGPLVTYRTPVDNDTTQPIFNMIGWTPNDLKLLRFNYFMDPDTYSVEKFHLLNQYFPQFIVDKNPQDTFGTMLSNPGFLVATAFFLATLPFLTGENLWFILLDALWTVLLLCFCRFYLWMPERIYLPCFFLLNNIVLFFVLPNSQSSSASPEKLSRFFKWGIALQVLCFVFTVYLAALHYVKVRYWAFQEKDLKVTMSYLKPQDDQVFVVWGSAFPFVKIGAFDDDEFLRHFHVIALDWFQRSPITRAMMDRYDLKNVLKDMVDNPKVFLIAHPDELNLYRTYIMEKYKKDITFKVYFNSGQFTVLSVHSE